MLRGFSAYTACHDVSQKHRIFEQQTGSVVITKGLLAWQALAPLLAALQDLSPSCSDMKKRRGLPPYTAPPWNGLRSAYSSACSLHPAPSLNSSHGGLTGRTGQCQKMPNLTWRLFLPATTSVSLEMALSPSLWTLHSLRWQLLTTWCPIRRARRGFRMPRMRRWQPRRGTWFAN